MLLNKLCECFNSQILQAEPKGIVTMNEEIMTNLMIRTKKEKKRCHAKMYNSALSMDSLKVKEVKSDELVL